MGFSDIRPGIRPCSVLEIHQGVGKASKPTVVAPSCGNTSVMTINCECDDLTRLPSGEGTMSPMVDSADGRIFQALLEAFSILSEVMQQTGKVCFIRQSEGVSELFSPFRDVP